MGILIQHPLYLLAIPTIILIGSVAYLQTTNYVSPWKFFCLLGTGICLSLASSSPMLPLGEQPEHLVFIIDTSDSNDIPPEEIIRPLSNMSRTLQDRDVISILLFGKNNRWLLKRAGPDRVPNALNAFANKREQIDGSGSNPADAVNSALQLNRQDEKMITYLLSDGQFPEKQRKQLHSIARNENVHLHTALSRNETLSDIWIQSLSAPSIIQENTEFTVQVTVRASRSYRGTIRLIDQTGKTSLDNRSFTIGKDQTRTFRMNINPQDATYQKYQVVLDTEQEEWNTKNNRYTFNVRSSGTVNVLWTGTEKLFEQLRSGLNKTSVRFDQKNHPTRTDKYDLFILTDTVADLSVDWRNQAAQAIRNQGSGLIMLGTKRSFALGGWKDTEIEDLLPVRVFPPDRLFLSILLDVSGSMSHVSQANLTEQKTKLRVVTEAITNALQLLKPSDQVEVRTFSDRATLLRPFKKIGSNNSIQEKLQNLEAQGGTKMLPPLQQALQTLPPNPTEQKHLLIFTDGQLTGDQEAYEQVSKRVQKQDIQLLILTTGSSSDRKLLRTLTNNGQNGRVISLDHINTLKTTLQNELRRIRHLIHEPITSVKSDMSRFPLLSGVEKIPERVGSFHRVTEKKHAIVPLQSRDGQVLLAGWQPGQGRTVALTPRYDDMERLSPSEQTAWVNLLNSTIHWARPNRPSDWSVQTMLSADTLTMFLERKNESMNRDSIQLNGHLKRGENRVRKMKASAYSQRMIRFRTQRPPAGTYQFSAEVHTGNQTDTFELPVNIPIEPEYLHPVPDADVLQNVARSTGGSYFGSMESLRSESSKSESRKTNQYPLDRFFLFGALLFLLLVPVRF